ncbi:hypothetical protein [Streptomyces sp. NPDC056010]|uniref:hypothetical protein n=1 Tax=Streptomyces sp. NPDC056010 TaxID=3345679 RepID=UPI0035D9928E
MPMSNLVSLALEKGLDLLGTSLGPWLFVVLLVAAAAGTWLFRRSHPVQPEPPRVRSFTLLRTEGADGVAVQYETTRPAGTRITPWVDGYQRLYELTDVRLEDGSYAAEPLDQL